MGLVKGSCHLVGGQFLVGDEKGSLPERLGVKDAIERGSLERSDGDLDATSQANPLKAHPVQWHFMGQCLLEEFYPACAPLGGSDQVVEGSIEHNALWPDRPASSLKVRALGNEDFVRTQELRDGEAKVAEHGAVPIGRQDGDPVWTESWQDRRHARQDRYWISSCVEAADESPKRAFLASDERDPSGGTVVGLSRIDDQEVTVLAMSLDPLAPGEVRTTDKEGRHGDEKGVTESRPFNDQLVQILNHCLARLPVTGGS